MLCHQKSVVSATYPPWWDPPPSQHAQCRAEDCTDPDRQLRRQTATHLPQGYSWQLLTHNSAAPGTSLCGIWLSQPSIIFIFNKGKSRVLPSLYAADRHQPTQSSSSAKEEKIYMCVCIHSKYIHVYILRLERKVDRLDLELTLSSHLSYEHSLAAWTGENGVGDSKHKKFNVVKNRLRSHRDSPCWCNKLENIWEMNMQPLPVLLMQTFPQPPYCP